MCCSITCGGTQHVVVQGYAGWYILYGAGDGNRTRTASLEGWSSAIELPPLVLVGVTGLEPATSWSQTKRSTNLSYTPPFALLL